MTLLDIYHEAWDDLESVTFQINKYTKRGKDVPVGLLDLFGIAWTVYQGALGALKKLH